MTCGLLQSIASLGKEAYAQEQNGPESGLAPHLEATLADWIPALGARVMDLDLRRACLSWSVAGTQGAHLSQTSLSATPERRLCVDGPIANSLLFVVHA